MKEQRDQERRDFDSTKVFPFLDGAGKIIVEDRRRMADRRLNNIWLELVTLPLGDVPPDWGR
jgi:hypothetical protein